ncbi:glucokinase [Desulfitobacterium chlororespirans DSM 11544]|uniref:Glucokinase n=1 Tax=Desulfitobacterium chlororespirans DSM 11544 TaxID=1121395 RepID=A0A1M7UQQ8_9FIRM|nr:glucokinase [Desulfitobacterium chlororespirans DSM 11544]
MPYAGIEKGQLYLAGDIGGTKTLLGLYSLEGTELVLVRERNFPSKDWQDLTALIQGFLGEIALTPEDITGGCLSLAGPITRNKCFLTNLNRVIDCPALRSSLPLRKPLILVNDLEAMGRGLMDLRAEDLLCLNPSAESPSSSLASSPALSLARPSLNRALIAPGTGLGQAMILADGRVCATEGAHGDYAPCTEQEVRLWRFLAQRYGHVSYERVLSGPGLADLYQFLHWETHSSSAYAPTHDPVSDSIPAPAPIPTPAEIAKRALAGICPLCTEALELFVKILGAEAGNLALRTLAYGGIYLGGGIPPKILPKLQEDGFREAFLAKGRLRDLLAQIPIYVILNERTALLGAAHLAAAAGYSPA